MCVWLVDQLVLFCEVSCDLTYTRATPTFHHWQTGSCSYGLTFQSPSEAETFARTVDRAVRHKEGTIDYLFHSTVIYLVGWLEFNVPFQHKYGYIRDKVTYLVYVEAKVG